MPEFFHSDAEERRAQSGAARELAARDTDSPATARVVRATRSARPALTPKGHEAFLKALELSGATLCVQKVNGTIVLGVLRHSDKYTLTVRTPYDGGTRDRVLFKHDISEFFSMTPRVKAG